MFVVCILFENQYPHYRSTEPPLFTHMRWDWTIF